MSAGCRHCCVDASGDRVPGQHEQECGFGLWPSAARFMVGSRTTRLRTGGLPVPIQREVSWWARDVAIAPVIAQRRALIVPGPPPMTRRPLATAAFLTPPCSTPRDPQLGVAAPRVLRCPVLPDLGAEFVEPGLLDRPPALNREDFQGEEPGFRYLRIALRCHYRIASRYDNGISEPPVQPGGRPRAVRRRPLACRRLPRSSPRPSPGHTPRPNRSDRPKRR